jgi:hypothetical protein
MRKSLWIMLAVLLVAIGAPNAYADSETPTFTCRGTCVGGTPTAPDVSFPAPVFDVTWNDVLFSYTLPSSDLPTDSYTWFGDTGLHATFSVTNQFLFNPVQIVSPAFTPTATPEPSTIALMLLGVGLVFVMRNRKVQRLLQAI